MFLIVWTHCTSTCTTFMRNVIILATILLIAFPPIWDSQIKDAYNNELKFSRYVNPWPKSPTKRGNVLCINTQQENCGYLTKRKSGILYSLIVIVISLYYVKGIRIPSNIYSLFYICFRWIMYIVIAPGSIFLCEDCNFYWIGLQNLVPTQK